MAVVSLRIPVYGIEKASIASNDAVLAVSFSYFHLGVRMLTAMRLKTAYMPLMASTSTKTPMVFS